MPNHEVYLSEIVWNVVRFLSGEGQDDYDIYREARVQSADFDRAIREYGRNLTIPPFEAYKALDFIPIQNDILYSWAVAAPLWTKEEGRSDLSVELTISIINEVNVKVYLDDCGVM